MLTFVAKMAAIWGLALGFILLCHLLLSHAG